ALGIAEYVVPVLRTSKFRETGVITPGEFVAAGDFLVHHCPTWQWAVGDKAVKSYLPSDKQFLVTRNVPCYKRVRQVDNHNEDLEKVIEDDEIGGEWVDTHHYASQSAYGYYKPVSSSRIASRSTRDAPFLCSAVIHHHATTGKIKG
ncbi:unnamed protein product, partial [Echinostoma caproni]|uniref:Ubiquitin-like-conjugating enzyme ATG3 n=1 Tax=Echinostoma caproni TaxID=27848 RepID=A0A183AXD1_9TREM